MFMRWYKDRAWLAGRPIVDTFEYYDDIASYNSRYPTYYGNIDVMYESNGILNTKEFLNLNLDKDRDHVSIEGEYRIDKPNKISFELKGDNIVESISGGLTFIPTEFIYNKERREGTLVSGTISALEMISLPPGSKDGSEYEKMLVYFGERDDELIEGKPVNGYREGQQCTKCGKGKLQISAKKERTRIDREFPLADQENMIDVLGCDHCGNSFENVLIRLK